MTDTGFMALALIVYAVTLGGFGVWLWGLESEQEETRADVDELRERLDAVEAWATGTEPVSSGRHADPEPPSYRSPTWPGVATGGPIVTSSGDSAGEVLGRPTSNDEEAA